MLDEDGSVILKKGKPVADPSLRDTENIPMGIDIDEYLETEQLQSMQTMGMQESTRDSDTPYLSEGV